MPLIKLQKVSKTYNPGRLSEVKALQNICLRIEKGDFLAIMGPSGSGKSTLMHIIGLLDRPDSGQYFFKDEDISKKKQKELAFLRNKKIGFIFQTFNLIPRLSAKANIELPQIYAKIPQKERLKNLQKVLKATGLEKRAKHLPNELSGGEQQRAAIARALINNPEIILADEPTGNLDTKSGQQILTILKNLNKIGHTIILITHEAHIAKAAQKIIKIQDGKIQK